VAEFEHLAFPEKEEEGSTGASARGTPASVLDFDDLPDSSEPQEDDLIIERRTDSTDEHAVAAASGNRDETDSHEGDQNSWS
jgi:hypothetical protein